MNTWQIQFLQEGQTALRRAMNDVDVDSLRPHFDVDYFHGLGATTLTTKKDIRNVYAVLEMLLWLADSTDAL
jgi:hypothetical protein